MLKGKNVLIFVSGSIAAYKILDVISSLRKEKANIRVVATSAALRFITPLSFEALSNTKLLSDESEDWSDKINGLNHIAFAKWANIALFAPLSANSLNKLAHGIADNVYLSTAIALRDIPKLLAPSANNFMLEAPQTMHSLNVLKSYGYEIIEPETKLLACGDEGKGALANTEEIVFRVKRSLLKNAFWSGKNVVITGGGSVEKIDDIRCVSNFSSGLQASYLALALYFLGARVSFISSKFPLCLPKDIKTYSVQSSKEYKEKLVSVLDSIESKGYLFMAAAISDYLPKATLGKIKKLDHPNGLKLDLSLNEDLLSSIKQKNIIKIGFKAEHIESSSPQDALKSATSLITTKGCSYVCLNVLNKDSFTESKDSNQMVLLDAKDLNAMEKTQFLSKLEISFEIANFIEKKELLEKSASLSTKEPSTKPKPDSKIVDSKIVDSKVKAKPVARAKLSTKEILEQKALQVKRALESKR
ncbi:hypothetical protein BKH43_01495 [Helicobacter sp. 13S00401-1]|uniref:bifunctional phosphopantothenoylcysteine decarboxylase/phosphopantothenate--cysteine ligase CoaBC n=1 Tax=Helicobacter sp. 13S00401-1 TaxID=1905758 RepID=UPI000BA70AF7|nr:bifunctional phosphopantothenoylcysteine decarboxylase/phosphopantothenate--cysteine ligase CoaBC [Helicobacter sp. 13S00401-1]PAF51340.1 hypothetical protein BKH43_01495 [Helicobacter sp. 13S00401-1]